MSMDYKSFSWKIPGNVDTYMSQWRSMRGMDWNFRTYPLFVKRVIYTN